MIPATRVLWRTTVAAILPAATPATAQPWRPDKPVELLVGSGAGGSNDSMGRHLQKINVFGKVVVAEEWLKSLEAQFWEGNFLRNREFAKYLENDYSQTKAVMNDLGLAK